jgi:hypothetical protein
MGEKRHTLKLYQRYLEKINRMIEKTEYSNDIFTPKIKAGINYLGKM